MLLTNVEHMTVQLAALGIVAAALLAVADTAAYPIALGVVIVALIYVLIAGGGSATISGLTGFVKSHIGGGA